MQENDAVEQAYRNGYEQGYEDAITEIIKAFTDGLKGEKMAVL